MSKVLAKVLGYQFIMLEKNEMVTILHSGSLITSEITALERNPAAIFLAWKEVLIRKVIHIYNHCPPTKLR
jgi:hypothetical protein